MITETDYNRRLQDEVAENLALQAALKRTRLEEAAKGPDFSRSEWISAGFAAGVLLFFREQLADFLWIIIPMMVVVTRSYHLSVHRRIDAIQKLEELNRTSQNPLTKHNGQGSGTSSAPLRASP